MSVKLYCLIVTFSNCHFSHIAQILLSHVRSSCCFRPGSHIFFKMRDIIIYAARWWEYYLSKSSFIKRNCSWRDKPNHMVYEYQWLFHETVLKLSEKKRNKQKITLNEKDEFISNDAQVAETFNEYLSSYVSNFLCNWYFCVSVIFVSR